MELLFKEIIKEELEELEISLLSSIGSDVDLATEVTQYVVDSGGKRIRPVICILVAKMLNYKGSELIKLASSIELLHTATLIHDDVVDQSSTRRGKQSIHNKWDNAHGVLVGDFVYSKAFQLMASFNNPEIIRILADSTNRTSEGEVLQLTFKLQNNLSEKDQQLIGYDPKTFNASSIKRLFGPWMKFFISFDPRPVLEKVKIPVLAINGEKDLQVPPKENLSEIKAALERGGNTDHEIHEIKSLNHLFQTSETGAVAEYGSIEETFNEGAMALMTQWILRTSAGGK